MTLTARIFTGMAAGIAVGLLANITQPYWTGSLFGTFISDGLIMGLFDVIGKIFIASLKVLVVPMVFVSLVCGTASLGEHGRMGMMAGKTISLYLLTTALAISLALLLALFIQPGVGNVYQTDVAQTASAAPSLKDVLVNISPVTRCGRWPRAICCRS